MRGGHKLDQHDHQDRGHVNFIAKGQPILIEAGTPSYDNLRMSSHYSSGVGHNVLQIGDVAPRAPKVPGEFVRPSGWQKPKGIAPITVCQINEAGGDIFLDGTRCYEGLQHWHRRVAWTSEQLTVTDDVSLEETAEEIILFRWHLATSQEVKINGEDKRFTIHWADATITFEGSEPLFV